MSLRPATYTVQSPLTELIAAAGALTIPASMTSAPWNNRPDMTELAIMALLLELSRPTSTFLWSIARALPRMMPSSGLRFSVREDFRTTLPI